MLYTLHETGYYGATPLRLAALATRDFWSSPLKPCCRASANWPLRWT